MALTINEIQEQSPTLAGSKCPIKSNEMETCKGSKKKPKERGGRTKC